MVEHASVREQRQLRPLATGFLGMAGVVGLSLRGDACCLKLLAAGVMDERLELAERPRAQIVAWFFSMCVATQRPRSWS
ncbi:hypothetical protein [Streptomyces californicus]|uniref:hypothetical protein n=1 Tax=Streptomyces californicus TaxID=67351 RepID=UPI001EF9B6EA|nr:hypothetical protein [Streptomyces californicus]